MITPINGRNLGLVRAGAAANAGSVQQPVAEAPPERSPLARNVESLVLDAYDAGIRHGEPQHFRSGWRWGVVAGLVPGALIFYGAQRLLQWAGLL